MKYQDRKRHLPAIIVAASFVLVSCSTINSKTDSTITSEFIGGALKVTYTNAGEFKSLESTATAVVIDELPSSREQAVSIATAKARRQIAEFLKTEIETDRFYEGISTDIQRSDQDKVSKEKEINLNIAKNVREQIKQKSSVILKGTYVASESFSDSAKAVTVIVKSSKEDMEISKSMKKAME